MYKSNYMMSGIGNSDRTALRNNPIYTVVAFWLLFVAQNADLGSSRIIWWGSVLLFVITYLMTYQMKIRLDSYAVWIGSFALISMASVLWAITPSLVLGTMKSMVVQIVVLIILRSSIHNQKDIEFVLKLVLFACVLNAIYIVCTNRDVLMNQNGKIAEQLGGQGGWNANDVGLMTSVGTLLSLYFFKDANSWGKKTAFFGFIVFLAFISLVTGSRKAIAILAGGTAAYIFISAKGKRLRALVLIVLILAVLWYMIMEIPYFHSVIGWRVEAFLSQFTGKGQLDSSAENRKILISAAVDAWKQKPLLGHGLDCFRYFGELATGRSYYAHNNYVELLADVGLVGFVIYYSGYLYILVKSWRNRRNHLSLLFFVLICVMLVSEYACVSYAAFFFGVLRLLMFADGKLSGKEDKYEQLDKTCNS